ncbi:unnamed protein product [Prorocentrum cordatum]|uniref:Uncharacterized protein n=1 Tax=Prorocentrum cordatum TaxID=2364126 RepID=A0ABN9UWP3_9DINO|nr:unnamed protein product [Polarella glacialis]
MPWGQVRQARGKRASRGASSRREDEDETAQQRQAGRGKMSSRRARTTTTPRGRRTVFRALLRAPPTPHRRERGEKVCASAPPSPRAPAGAAGVEAPRVPRTLRSAARADRGSGEGGQDSHAYANSAKPAPSKRAAQPSGRAAPCGPAALLPSESPRVHALPSSTAGEENRR